MTLLVASYSCQWPQLFLWLSETERLYNATQEMGPKTHPGMNLASSEVQPLENVSQTFKELAVCPILRLFQGDVEKKSRRHSAPEFVVFLGDFHLCE